MATFLRIILVFGIFLICFDLCGFIVVGFYVSDKRENDLIKKFNSEWNLIGNGNRFYFSDGSNTIAQTPIISLTAKWYIHNNGLVPRWGRLHKIIEQKRDSALKANPQKL